MQHQHDHACKRFARQTSELRHYPPRFGMTIVQLKNQLNQTSQGKPDLLYPITRLQDEVTAMDSESLGDIWSEAHMDEVLAYLRRNHNLRLLLGFVPCYPLRWRCSLVPPPAAVLLFKPLQAGIDSLDYLI